MLTDKTFAQIRMICTTRRVLFPAYVSYRALSSRADPQAWASGILSIGYITPCADRSRTHMRLSLKLQRKTSSDGTVHQR